VRILLVDDDAEGRSFLADYLKLLGHCVEECGSGEEAVNSYRMKPYDMVLSDIKMGGMSGIDLVRELKKTNPESETDVVLYTGFIDVELAIGALRAGAYDYLTKPINMDELKSILNRIEEHQVLLRENKKLTFHFAEEVKAATHDKEWELLEMKKIAARHIGIGKIGVFSEAMRQVVRQAEHYHTDRDIPILIQGETGVGKEIIAKIIHYGNMDTTRPFVDINCTAITPSLFESELFGYEAGAFTGGAARGQKGKLDMAMGGTLFLDEIAEISLDLQAKLLRVIEEKSFYRVGGLKKIKTDIRIIGATNLDFETRVAAGLFRKDLYYRLKVGQVEVPPLRQRKEDILPLALMFLEDFSKRRSKKFRAISTQAAQFLLSYDWPGNVRELRNLMEWVSFMYDEEELKLEHLHNLHPKTLAGDNDQQIVVTGEADNSLLGTYVDEMILNTIKDFNGNKTQAARHLGISVRTLYYRLERIQKRDNNK